MTQTFNGFAFDVPVFGKSPDQWGAKQGTVTTGLTYGYVGGSAMSTAGVLSLIADGTVTLTNNATNYVQRTYAGVVSTNTSGFLSTNVPMALIVTSSGTIQSFTDWRPRTGPFPYYPLLAAEGSTVTNPLYAYGDPKRYGAAGTGLVDDILAIRAAIAAVQGGTIRRAVWSYGTYKISDTASFDAWTDYLTPYEIDFGGSTIYAPSLTNKPALRFYCNSLLDGANLRLVGGTSTGTAGGTPAARYAASGSVGILVDSLQSIAGSDFPALRKIYVGGFDIDMDVGSHTPTSNRVAFATFEQIDLDGARIGMRHNGLVDKCSFNQINTSGCALAGFQLSQAGANIFNNPSGFGDYPLFLIDGPIGELTLNHPQSESAGTATAWSNATAYLVGDRVTSGGVIYTCIVAHTNQAPSSVSTYWTTIFTVLRTATGSGDGPARPMLMAGGTVNSPVQLGATGAGSAGGASQFTMMGCLVSAAVTINFADYYTTFLNVTKPAAGGGDITINGGGSRATVIGSSLRTLTAAAAGALFNLYETNYVTYSPSGGAPAALNSMQNGVVVGTQATYGTAAHRTGSTTTVSTSATVIHALTSNVVGGSLIVVSGSDNVANVFIDLVGATGQQTPKVLATVSTLGTPAVRTYSMAVDGVSIKLVMASGTYTIKTAPMETV